MAAFVRGVLVAVGLGCLSMACTVTTNPDGSVTLKPKTTFTKSGQTKTAQTDWTGQAIEVDNANGNVTVTGVAGLTKITASMTAFAAADGEKQADADLTITDVISTFAIDESSGKFVVKCGQGGSHGTAPSSLSGCQNLTIQIPAGTAAQGVTLSARAHNGSMTVSNVNGAAGAVISVLSDNGNATGTGLTGSAKVHSANGTVSADVVPTKGSNVEASSENGDTTLALPTDFAADSLSLSTGLGKVTITGFSDLTPASTSRGTAGTGAASVIVKTANGDVLLKSR